MSGGKCLRGGGGYMSGGGGGVVLSPYRLYLQSLCEFSSGYHGKSSYDKYYTKSEKHQVLSC